MNVRFCGVRGSTPAPGPAFVRYGGNTSCVAIAHDGARPSLVLDAGTGLSELSKVLDGQPFVGTILLGHLHWDHTHGLPFFGAGDRAGSSIDLYLPGPDEPEETLARALSPPHFPIRPDELRGTWRFHGLEPGDHELEGFSVIAREIPHKGGRTFGFRVSDGHSTIAYLSDHSPISLGRGPDGFGCYHETALELAREVDLLIHDAQHTAEEFESRKEYGHSAVDYAVGLAERANARRLMFFHHDPWRTDDDLDRILARWQDRDLTIDAAFEGLVVDL